MAEIKLATDPVLDLTERKVLGVLNVDEVLEVLAEFYRGKTTKLVLWDLSNADISSLTSADFSRVAEAVARYAIQFGDVKTAAVVSSNFAYGMTRMYQALRERGSNAGTFLSFRTRDEAFDWLVGKDDSSNDA